MKLHLNQFNGMSPIKDDKLLGPTEAQKAENVEFISGKMRPVRSPQEVALLESDSEIYAYPYNGRYLSWATDVDVVESPVAEDIYHRIYYTGDGTPKMKAIYNSVEETYDLALPAPTSPITLSLTSDGSISESILYAAYVYTYVTKFGEESAPSDPTRVITIPAGKDVSLSGFPATDPHGRGITSIRIYRTGVGDNIETSYYFAGEIELGTTTFRDTRTQSQLGELLPTDNAAEPPEGLSGLTVMAGGFLAAFEGNTVYFTEPYQPTNWNRSYSISFPADVVAIESMYNTLIVGTTEMPYQIDGQSPDSLVNTKLPLRQPCVSKRSMHSVGSIVFFAGSDGLVAVQNGQAAIFTKSTYSRQQWQAMAPEAMICGSYNRYLYIFAPDTTVVLDIDNRGLLVTTSDEIAQGCLTYYDSMYIIQDQYLFKWEAGDTYKYLFWKSPQVYRRRPMDFSCALVVADGYPVTLRIISEENDEVTEITVKDDKAFRLPQMTPRNSWEVEVESVFGIDEIVLSTSMKELIDG